MVVLVLSACGSDDNDAVGTSSVASGAAASTNTTVTGPATTAPFATLPPATAPNMSTTTANTSSGNAAQTSTTGAPPTMAPDDCTRAGDTLDVTNDVVQLAVAGTLHSLPNPSRILLGCHANFVVSGAGVAIVHWEPSGNSCTLSSIDGSDVNYISRPTREMEIDRTIANAGTDCTIVNNSGEPTLLVIPACGYVTVFSPEGGRIACRGDLAVTPNESATVTDGSNHSTEITGHIVLPRNGIICDEACQDPEVAPADRLSTTTTSSAPPASMNN
jgi:hypothetical protein